MNFQDRLIEASTELRARASSLTYAAIDLARDRAGLTSKRVDILKGSIATLSAAGRELNKVAQRHASRFVKENSTLAVAASKDIGALARSTYATLSNRKAVKTTARKPRATRKRTSRKAA